MSYYKGYIGSYTRRKSKGIRTIRFNEDEVVVEDFLPVENPTYLALAPAGRHLYSSVQEGEGGGVLSVDLHSRDVRTLTFQGEAVPCHLVLKDPYLLTANYHQGKLDLYHLEAGHPTRRLESIPHTGSGPVKPRQESAHIHQVVQNPYNGDILACDLGTDQIHVYRLDQGTLVLKETLLLPPGSGPRHMVFHGKQPLAYVFSELSSMVFTLDADAPGYRVRGAEPTLPEDFQRENTGAAIRISPDNRFLYVSNRGHDSIGILKVQENGLPKLMGHVPSEGIHPRDFNLTPDGCFLLAANMETDNLALFRVDKDTGALHLLRKDIYSPEPVSVIFEGG